MTDGARRRTEKRDLITEAAVDVFAEKGFHAARVSDVAKRAGVADGTIYLYFKNKEDLLLSVFEEKMDVLLEGLRADLAGIDEPEERIRRFAHHHFRQVRENRAAAEVLQVELRLSNKFLKQYRPEKLWAYLDVFGAAVRDGQARGRFRPEINPFLAMWAFFGSLDELAMQWVLARNQQRIPLEVAAEQVAEIFIGGMKVDTTRDPAVPPDSASGS